MSLLKSGINQKELIFNATGSGLRDWFKANRVITSPWTDIQTENINYFSIWGHCNSDKCRSFFINNDYGGCNGDTGWLMVTTNLGCNNYEGSKNKILYSDKSTYAVWDSNGEFSQRS